jgi:Ubiquinol-cytochrome C reductase complex 14kD subunit
MGRCEKVDAEDFNQKAADHRFCLPNLVISRPTHVLPTLTASSVRLFPSHGTLLAVHIPTMFGPLGISLAPYVRSSRTLSAWFKPIANWYANLSGYRKMGLVYDDLRASLNPHHLYSTLAKLRAPSSLPWCWPQVALDAYIFFM